MSTAEAQPPAAGAAPVPRLRFADELLLLLLKEDAEEVAVAETSLGYALAGALLMDLANENRIDTDLERLVVVDETPLADTLIDPVLASITAETTPRDAEFWVRRLAADAPRIHDAVIARLAAAGVLQADEAGLRPSPRVAWARKYPRVEDGERAEDPGRAEEEVRLRIMRVLFSDDIPAPRDVVIISLADACGFFERALSKEEYAECEGRLGVVRRLDLIGRAVAKAVREDATPPATPSPAAKPVPLAPGLPLLGQAVAMAKSPLGLFVAGYQRHGPVFRIRWPGRNWVVIAGAEANRFAHRKGRLYLRTQDDWARAVEEVGASQILTSLDGPRHTRLRKALARGYSRKTLDDKMAVAMEVCRRHIQAWPDNKPIAGKDAIQRLVVDQFGTVLAGMSPEGHFKDLTTFLDLLLLTRIARVLPMFLYRRRYNAAWRGVNALFEKTMREHRPGGSLADAGDLMNDVLDLHQADPQLLPETDILMAAIGPYVAGVDTLAITTSFMLYELLKDPDLAERVRSEADALFAGGNIPRVSDLGKMDVTRRVAMEVLRLYPPVPAVMRTASNSFELGGYRVSAGERLIVAIAVAHRLAEHFPEPQRFDIDRYLPPRSEHQQPDAYMPFGLGHHRCLAAGFSEALLILTVAHALHLAEFTLHPPGYQMRISPLPTPRPKPSFRIRKLRMRA